MISTEDAELHVKLMALDDLGANSGRDLIHFITVC
jgi:hypothetical protein